MQIKSKYSYLLKINSVFIFISIKSIFVFVIPQMKWNLANNNK